MAEARLEVTDALGQRTVPIDKTNFTIGRRDTNDLRLAGSEVSREHAEIVAERGEFLLRDCSSRYGSFVNGDPVTERVLQHGDRIRLGRGGGAEMVFMSGTVATPKEPQTATAIGDLRHVAALLEGLRALGSGRVLDDVLALVLDSAVDVSGAERGFIMLANPAGQLEFKLARSRGRITLPGRGFETSRKIPEEVFETGKGRIVADLLDGDLASMHTGTVALGIRHVLCVPLRLVRYVERHETAGGEERIGVLYLDSREKGSLLSESTRSALETLATEAAVAIENARLYRETIEKARMEQEMRIAAEIQRALLPKASYVTPHFEVAGTTIPCRSIGGDFFDYSEIPGGAFGFALGDVAGKGPPAALLSAMVQGILAAQTSVTAGASTTVARVNDALIRRAIEARFVTVMYGQLLRDGRLSYCNAGHNPPLIIGRERLVRLETGGPILGLFEGVPFEEETLQLTPGDWIIVFSDGVSEALSAAGEEFGEPRIAELVRQHFDLEPPALIEAIVTGVRSFTYGAAQNDDITALVIKYRG
jgi:phosphoserine phosphatase RsbU/P